MLTLPKAMSTLPREVRDTLFLLAVIAALALLQAPYVPVWCSGLALAVLVGRAWLALQLRPLPGLVWRLGLLLVATTGTWISHRTLLGRDPGVTLIVVLLALKTLELRARRDAFVVFFLGFFSLLAYFTNTQSLLETVSAVLVLWGLMSALVLAHMPLGRPTLWLAARLAASMMALGTPIMLALFLFFPRVAPLWGIPSDGLTGRSGLSSQMEVGQIARLVLDDSVAMRIRFEGPTPPPHQMYFRGPVLGRFDGRVWLPDPVADREPADLEVVGPALRYEVTQEPSHRPWLLLLEATAQSPALPGYSPRMNAELQWRISQPITDLLRYRAGSHVEFRHGLHAPLLTRQRYVELPGGFNPRTLQLAQDMRRRLTAGARDADTQASTLVQAVLERLRTGGYRYTLEPGVFGRHTADEFWFDKQAGFCEHIASSFVVLMRALDIPARVVTGYQGGELNTLDGYWVVRQRDAHAWAEVWLPSQGWTRVDPTAAVMPARVGELQRLSRPTGLIAGAVVQWSPSLAAQIRLVWDAINNRWNQWILNYTQTRQLDLLRALGFEFPDWTDLGYVLAVLAGLATLTGLAWVHIGRPLPSPGIRMLESARRRLRAAGLSVPPHATPRQLAELVAQAQGTRAGTAAFDTRLHDWLEALEQLCYDPQSTHDLASLQRSWSALHWPPAVHGAMHSGLR